MDIVVFSKDFGKFNLKRAYSKHKYTIYYLATC